MLDRVRELWTERPALLAAVGIAPLAFVVTLVVLFLVAGGEDSTQSQDQALTAQEAQAAPQSDQADDAEVQQRAASEPEVTVIVQGEQPTSQDDEPEQAAAQAAEQAEQASEPVQSESQPEQPQESVPTEVAGFEVVSLNSLLEDGYDVAALKHGSDGSEGAILPLGNGVVRSSGDRHETSWEIIIPSAGLKSAVVSLGRTPTGAMGSPDNPYVVGWLDSTAAPGEAGNTLLAGHRDYEDISGNIGTGVCWELNNTRIGDHMLIWDAELNVYYVYTVTETVTLDPTKRESARYLHNTEEPVVTLITCTGSFNTETNRYSHRLVVVGELAAVASPDA